jgi:hypothetical protein
MGAAGHPSEPVRRPLRWRGRFRGVGLAGGSGGNVEYRARDSPRAASDQTGLSPTMNLSSLPDNSLR